MKKQKFKAFSILLMALVAVFAVILLQKDKGASLKLNNNLSKLQAYTLVEKSFFLNQVDLENSDYDSLKIYLQNDDFGEYEIVEELETLYANYDLYFENRNLVPVGEHVSLRYEATKGEKTSSLSLKETLSFKPELVITDLNGVAINDKLYMDSDQNLDDVLNLKAMIKKFDHLSQETPITLSHSIEELTPGHYPVTVTSDEYGLQMELTLIIEESGDQVADLSRLDVLVNKQYHLNDQDVPPLKQIPIRYSMDASFEAQPVAVDAFVELVDTMKSETGMSVVANSAYRSYQYQVGLFNTFANREGIEEANKFSARAGQSEHQTGLAIDVTKPGVFMDNFGTTEESVWIADNAHRFGFIIRFPEGKEAITGYMYEPWHLRYLGLDLAAKVKESGLTYDEYWKAYLR